jgi:hypothetical protein
MSEPGIITYDLQRPLMPGDPGYPITPRYSPFRDRGERSPMPRYVPGPQPEGTVRVVLETSGPNGEPADFRLYDDYPTLVEPYRVFDVPREQAGRWAQAKEAFGVMEEEIEALISDRARDPLPRPSPGLPY